MGQPIVLSDVNMASHIVIYVNRASHTNEVITMDARYVILKGPQSDDPTFHVTK